MPFTLSSRPEADEHSPYFGRYITLVSESDIVSVLQRQIKETLPLLAVLTETQAAFRYAADKWSIKQVVGHLIDVERIMAYRALHIARNDQIALPGFEQDDYMRFAPFDHCAFPDLLTEFEHVRTANVHMFRNLDAEAWSRRGKVNDNETSVRALAYIIAGHELHHRKIVREKYFHALNRV